MQGQPLWAVPANAKRRRISRKKQSATQSSLTNNLPRASIFSMEITLYTAFWCPDCRTAKRFLEKHNVPFTEIDIETTPGAAQEVIRRTGKRAIPQFVIDGEWIQPYRPGEGFLHEEMRERLGLSE